MPHGPVRPSAGAASLPRVPDRASAPAPAPDLPRRLAAEAVGTAILVFFGAASIVAALGAGGDAPGYAPLIGIAFAHALALATAIHAFGATSGAHINPVVTLALAAVRRFPAGEIAPYSLAQLAGGVVGALLVIAVFGSDAVEVGAAGSTEIAAGVSFGAAVVAETIGTFLLVTAIMALAVDRRAPAGWAPLGIGFALAAGILAVGPLTGASFNPARTFGPLVANSLFGGDAAWGDIWVYLLGPAIGAVLGAFAYDALARPRRAEAAREPAQGTQGDIVGRRDDAAADRGALPAQGAGGDVLGRRG